LIILSKSASYDNLQKIGDLSTLLTSVTSERKAMTLTYLERARSTIRHIITATVPAEVWKTLSEQVPWAYAEVWDEVKNDPRVLPDQAGFKAAHDRHFFLEYTLNTIAKKIGADYVSSVVVENSWRFGLLRSGKISLTQKCVGSPGEIPPPAVFSQRLATSNGFIRQRKFAFLQDAVSVTEAEINGILIHGPESRNFKSSGFSRPAFVCYAVPSPDYSEWIAKFDLAELIASYQPEVAKTGKPEPKWKVRRQKEDGKQ
jgi:hypothetical protein